MEIIKPTDRTVKMNIVDAMMILAKEVGQDWDAVARCVSFIESEGSAIIKDPKGLNEKFLASDMFQKSEILGVAAVTDEKGAISFQLTDYERKLAEEIEQREKPGDIKIEAPIKTLRP